MAVVTGGPPPVIAAPAVVEPKDAMPPHVHDLERPDARIRYWTAGSRGNPAILFLHGATLDHHAWTPQVDALAGRFRTVAPDLRGHGDSTGRFRFAAAVDDVLALLDAIGAPDVVVVGLSLGGNIAQDVLHRAPHRVRALVAADTTCNTAARNPFATAAVIASLHAQAAMAGGAFARHAARATATNPDVQRYALEANARRTNRETIDILTSLLTASPPRDPGYRLPVPSLLVHGELDRIGDIAAETRAWSQREPLARYAVIPGAGHASNLDNPGAFNDLLVSFLDALPLDDMDEQGDRAPA